MDEFVPVLFVGVLHLSDGPAPDALRRALDALQSALPLLRVSITDNNGSQYFALSDNPRPIPLDIVKRTSAEQWREIAEIELNTAIDTAVEPLVRCKYLNGARKSDLVITVHHTIIDSRSGTMLIHRILELCDESGSGNSEGAAAGEQTIASPMEALFPRRLTGMRRIFPVAAFLARQAALEVRYRIRLGNRQVTHAETASRCRTLSIELPREDTAKLVRRSRNHGMPLNSLLHAAMLQSVAKRRYGSQSLLMRGISFADMRPYLESPPEAEALGVYISMLPYTVEMAPEIDFWWLAGEIGQQIYLATKHDDKFIAPQMSKYLVRMLIARHSMRLGMIALSYVGPVALHETYGRTKVDGLSGFVSNNVLGPELAAFGALLHGRLKMDFLYHERDMGAAEASEIAEDVRTTLVSVANEKDQVAT